jgi:hypothetical protein
MNDTTIVPPHRRRAEPSAPAPVTEAAPEVKPKTNLYVVKGADIWTSTGRKAVGTEVELTPSEARHFTKHGLLAPYIPGEEHEG